MKKARNILSILLIVNCLCLPANVLAADTKDITTENGEITKVNVQGSVTPLTINVTVPTSLSFGINPNNENCVTTACSEIKNNTPADIDIEFLGFKSKESNKTKIIDNDDFNDDEWNKLGKKDTESKIALGIKDDKNVYWSPKETDEKLNESIGTIKLAKTGTVADTKPIELVVKTGKAWASTTSLSYDMYLKIKVSENQTSIEPQEPKHEYILAKDEDFQKNGDTFSYIGNDEYIEIPRIIQGVEITSYKNMFNRDNNQLKGVKSTNKNITDMTDMFFTCKANSLDLSELDTSNVTSMHTMFNCCEARKIDVSGFDTSNVKDMTEMFKQSDVLSLDLRNFDTSKVTGMIGMFEDASAVNLNLSSFDTSNVINMRSMFSGYDYDLHLESFEFKDNVILTEFLIYMNRQTVYVKNEDDINLIKSNSRVDKNLQIQVGNGICDDIYIDYDGFIFNKTNSKILKYIGKDKDLYIPTTIDGVEPKIIESYCFANMNKIYVPKNIETIKEDAFRGLSNATLYIEGNQGRIKGDSHYWGSVSNVNWNWTNTNN